mmetsp:Transcript_27897/g.32162  ORF Transcript_27897/g.32162 Transcript_27897/m.32162 type:complete len:97 (-) Transcript_27897:559-849(-)
MLVIIVFLESRASPLSICMSATALVESNPLVGSSNKIAFGSVRSSVPMLTRFRSPPDIIIMGVSAQLSRRSWTKILSTSACFSTLEYDGGRRSNAV